MNPTKHISFEFFPPKTPEGMANLERVAQQLGSLSPEFFSVTYGAGGSTRQGTLDTAMKIHHATQIPVAPHIACIGAHKDEIIQTILNYKAMGAKRLVALRGDLPSGMGMPGDFHHAVKLVGLIREITGNYFHIEVAAYPEFHPQAQNAMDDVIHLKEKIAAGANSAITQYFFNPDAYFYFLDQCAAQGIFVPITPGIMPIMHFERLERFSAICGAEIPRWLHQRLKAYENDIESMRAFGLEVTHRLCERLLAGGAPGLHFYTLNQAELSVALVKRLVESLKPVEKIGAVV